MGDVGKDPLPIIKESVRLTRKMKNVQILWASTREAYNYLQAKDSGCSIITIPPNIWNGFKGLNKGHSIIANCLNLSHNEKEMVRLDVDDKRFNYKW